jgi:hypothetical protein
LFRVPPPGSLQCVAAHIGTNDAGGRETLGESSRFFAGGTTERKDLGPFTWQASTHSIEDCWIPVFRCVVASLMNSGAMGLNPLFNSPFNSSPLLGCPGTDSSPGRHT